MDKLMYRVAEAAKLTGYSESYLYRLALSNEIPHLRLGRSIRIPHAALMAWIASQQQGPAVPDARGTEARSA